MRLKKNKLKVNKIIFLVFFSILIICIGIFLISNKKGGLTAEKVELSAEQKVKFEDCIKNANELRVSNNLDDVCYTTIGVELRNISLCENIVNKDRRITCYYYVAIYSRNFQYCEKIQLNNNDLMMLCKGITSRNQTYCEKIDNSNWKDDCHEIVNSNLNSTSPCEVLPSTIESNTCYIMIFSQLFSI